MATSIANQCFRRDTWFALHPSCVGDSMLRGLEKKEESSPLGKDFIRATANHVPTTKLSRRAINRPLKIRAEICKDVKRAGTKDMCSISARSSKWPANEKDFPCVSAVSQPFHSRPFLVLAVLGACCHLTSRVELTPLRLIFFRRVSFENYFRSKKWVIWTNKCWFPRSCKTRNKDGNTTERWICVILMFAISALIFH